jgi:hypothetical protein
VPERRPVGFELRLDLNHALAIRPLFNVFEKDKRRKAGRFAYMAVRSSQTINRNSTAGAPSSSNPARDSGRVILSGSHVTDPENKNRQKTAQQQPSRLTVA